MGVQSAATMGASRNRIGAYTRGPASWADSYAFPGWRGQPACLTDVFPRMGVLGERTTEESYATLSWNQLPEKFKAERRFRKLCIGS